jgi:hypothetical protein
MTAAVAGYLLFEEEKEKAMAISNPSLQGTKGPGTEGLCGWMDGSCASRH